MTELCTKTVISGNLSTYSAIPMPSLALNSLTATE